MRPRLYCFMTAETLPGGDMLVVKSQHIKPDVVSVGVTVIAEGAVSGEWVPADGVRRHIVWRPVLTLEQALREAPRYA